MESSAKQGIHVRPSTPSNLDFLLSVYAATRLEEMSSWGWSAPQQQAFVKMQFDARRGGYGAAYPGADESIILDGEMPVGSLLVWRAPAQIRLVDVALLSEHRNRGIGRQLISELLAEAAARQLPLRLSVPSGNPAIHLYTRLGFEPIGENAAYIEMEYNWEKSRAHA